MLLWLRSFVPRHDSQAAGCSCPSTCLLTTPACPWLQPSHTVQSIKLQYKNKLYTACFFGVFLALCSASHVISPCLSQTKPVDDTSHFLPLSVLEVLFCLCWGPLRTAGRWHHDCRCTHPKILHTVWRPPEMLATRLEKQGKQEDVGHLGQLPGHVIHKYLSLWRGPLHFKKRELFY